MTDKLESLSRIERLALQVVLDTPDKQNKYASTAKVDWDIVHALEAEFAAKGFDLAAGRRVARDLKHKRRADAVAARYAPAR